MLWYVIYTKPKCEDAVADMLRGAGLEVLNPKIRVRKLIRRKSREVTGPLFPCYLFARFDIYESYRMVKYTRGLRKIIGTDNAPSPVPEGVIARIREKMVDGVVSMPRQGFSPGERVWIKTGSFEGFDAVFEKGLNGTERVCVLLKALNVQIVLDPVHLSRAGGF